MTRNPDRGRRNRTGFTLIELIMVIVILAILAAAVIPQAVGTAALQAQSAARMVLADLEYAQNQAIVTQVETTVTFDVNGNSYVVSNASGVLIHPITKQTYSVDFDTQNGFGSVSVSSADFDGDVAVTFDSLGAPAASGSVDVTAGSHGYRVTVAPVTGRVSVAEME